MGALHSPATFPNRALHHYRGSKITNQQSLLQMSPQWNLLYIIFSLTTFISYPHRTQSRRRDKNWWTRLVNYCYRVPSSGEQMIVQAIPKAAEAWKVDDYILDGSYCDTISIRSELRNILAHSDSQGILLFVWIKEQEPDQQKENHKLFQSLLLFQHRSPDTEREIQHELMKPLKIGETPLLTQGARLLGSILGKLAGLRDIKGNAPFSAFTEHFGSKTRAKFVWLSHPRGLIQEMKIGILLLEPGRFRRTFQSIHFNRLYTMIHASAPVVVHRNLRLIRSAERLIHEKEKLAQKQSVTQGRRDSQLDFQRISRPLLQAALESTNSYAGCLYLASSDRRKLRLLDCLGPILPINEIPLEGTNSMVAYIFRRRRPLVIHPEMSERWSYDEGNPTSPTIGIPIILPSVDPPETKVLGVMKINKHPEDLSHYSTDDVTVLRIIALHFCLQHWELISKSTNERLANLTTTQFGALSPELEKALRVVIDPETPLENWNKLIPIEYFIARDQITDALHHAQELTSTRLGTIRFLSRGGFYLIRFSALPETATGETRSLISIVDRGSVNAWVARSGKECHLPDLKAPKPYRNYPGLKNPYLIRERSRSVYCTPIFVRSRLVGTLYVESEYANAFRPHLSLLRGIAEQIRLSIIRAQSLSEQKVLSLGARTALNSHELLKCGDELARISKELEIQLPGLAMQLQGVQVRLKRCLEDSPRPEQEEDRKLLDQVVAEVIRERNLSHFCEWRTDLSITTNFWISGTSASALRLALGEVLENAFLKATPIPHSSLSLQIRKEVRGGQEYLALRVSHPLRDPMPDERLMRIYRVPFFARDRLHLGAFLAGSVLRSVGGDVWMTVNENEPNNSCRPAWATTVLEIPRETGN